MRTAMTRRTLVTRRTSTVGLAAAGMLVLASCGDDGTGDADTAGGESNVSIDRLSMVVPADPGGGWDQTGRTIQQDLQDAGLVESTSVVNVGGAGGTIGLAQVASEQNAHTLMVTGLVMVGAIETNQSEATLDDVTPIAKLTEEPLVVVVPADSPYETITDLVDDMTENGQDVSITGGSAGGADHILAGQLLTSAGVPAAEVSSLLNYIPYSGGGESLAALLGDKVSAGISGVGEYAEQIKAGELRGLAVSSPESSALVPEIPTLTDEGIDLVLTNWRGVVAPGGISDDDASALSDLMTSLYETDEWQASLEEYAWADAFATGDEFATFIEEDVVAVRETLANIGLVE